MRTVYNGHSTKSGVYAITNQWKLRYYVGSAKRFKSRYSHHLASLRKGTHHNKFLQNDFNRCGEAAFVFEVLEVVNGEQSDRLLAEQRYLDSLHDDQDSCYNFDKKSEGSSRSCFSKSPEETRKKKSEYMKNFMSNEKNRKNISDKLRGVPKPPRTTEHRQNMSKAKTGTVVSDETRQKMSESAKKNCQNPDHLKMKSDCGKKRWDEHPEHKQSLSKTMKEYYINNPVAKEIVAKNSKERWQDPEYKARHVRALTGQKRSEAMKSKMSELKTGNSYGKKSYLFISPDGVETKVVNLKEFCDRNNLSVKCMYRLCWDSKRTHHKGWKLINKLVD